MSNEQILEEVVRLIKKISSNESLNISLDTLFTDIEEWDSLNTVDLEMEIEQQMDVAFQTGEFQEYTTVKELIDALSKKKNSTK